MNQYWSSEITPLPGPDEEPLTEEQWYEREYLIKQKNRGCSESVQPWHKWDYCDQCDNPDGILLYPKHMAEYWAKKEGNEKLDSTSTKKLKKECPLSIFLFHRLEKATCPGCQEEKFWREAWERGDELHADE